MADVSWGSGCVAATCWQREPEARLINERCCCSFPSSCRTWQPRDGLEEHQIPQGRETELQPSLTTSGLLLERVWGGFSPRHLQTRSGVCTSVQRRGPSSSWAQGSHSTFLELRIKRFAQWNSAQLLSCPYPRGSWRHWVRAVSATRHCEATDASRGRLKTEIRQE